MVKETVFEFKFAASSKQGVCMVNGPIVWIEFERVFKEKNLG